MVLAAFHRSLDANNAPENARFAVGAICECGSLQYSVLGHRREASRGSRLPGGLACRIQVLALFVHEQRMQKASSPYWSWIGGITAHFSETARRSASLRSRLPITNHIAVNLAVSSQDIVKPAS